MDKWAFVSFVKFGDYNWFRVFSCFSWLVSFGVYEGFRVFCFFRVFLWLFVHFCIYTSPLWGG